MKSQICKHTPIIKKWIASIPAEFIKSWPLLLMTTLPSAHIYLSDTSISCFHLYSECVQFQTMIYILIIRKWSRYHLCIFAKLTPVHTTDVKDFARSTEIIRKKRQIRKFLKDYIRLLRLFLYICSISFGGKAYWPATWQ